MRSTYPLHLSCRANIAGFLENHLYTMFDPSTYIEGAPDCKRVVYNTALHLVRVIQLTDSLDDIRMSTRVEFGMDESYVASSTAKDVYQCYRLAVHAGVTVEQLHSASRSHTLSDLILKHPAVNGQPCAQRVANTGGIVTLWHIIRRCNMQFNTHTPWQNDSDDDDL